MNEKNGIFLACQAGPDIFLKNLFFAKIQTTLTNGYKKSHIQIVVAILTIVIKRKIW